MARITDRASFIKYIKQRLGEPVIQLNMDDAQIDDRVDDALDYFRLYHYNAVEKIYLAWKISQQDIDNQYFILPDSIAAVQNVWCNSRFFVNDQVVSVQMYEAIRAGNTTRLIDFTKSIDTIESLLRKKPMWTFNSTTHRLMVQTDYSYTRPGQYFMFEVYNNVDPEVNPALYNDPILKQLATLHVKQQWGQNLMKYTGLALPGNVELNGTEIYSSAREELTNLEERIQLEFQLPASITLG